MCINRALSPTYPGSICGVVFQGQYRRHKCQFSFACDGLSDRPKHRVLWRKALRMANKLVNVRGRTGDSTGDVLSCRLCRSLLEPLYGQAGQNRAPYFL